MKLSGEATLNATVDEVYAALNDPAVLVRTIPGCQRLEQVGVDSYRATIVAGVAAVKGTFDGDVRLSDQDAPRAFTLHASGVGAPGTVTAVARVTLEPVDAHRTRLTYDADATVGGVIGGVGQRMITGVARKTAEEFFGAVERALMSGAASAPGGEVVTGELPMPDAGSASASVVDDEPGPPVAEVSSDAAPTLPRAAVRTTAPSAAGGIWAVPERTVDAGQRRSRDLFAGAMFGAVVALLGVVVGAIVVRW